MSWPHEDGLPALVLDVLETFCGEWLPIETIVFEVMRVRPSANEDTVRRAVWRVFQRGKAERRLVDTASEATGMKVYPTAEFRVAERGYLAG